MIKKYKYSAQIILLIIASSVIFSTFIGTFIIYHFSNRVIEERKKFADSFELMLKSMVISNNDIKLQKHMEEFLYKVNSINYLFYIKIIFLKNNYSIEFPKNVIINIDDKKIIKNITIKTIENDNIINIKFIIDLTDEYQYQKIMFFILTIFIIFSTSIYILLILWLIKKLLEPYIELMFYVNNLSSDNLLKFTKYLSVKDERYNLCNMYNKIVDEIIYNKEQSKKIIQVDTIVLMAQMLAHDVRKPLEQIMMGLDIVVNDLNNHSLKNEYLNEVKQTYKKVQNMINDLLSFNSTSVKIIKEKINLNEILSNIKVILNDKIKLKQIYFYENLNYTNELFTDPNKFERILLNIIDNACDVVTDNAYIKITTYSENNFFCLDIYNNGKHIPLDIINNIFNPFVTFAKTNGTGLGLSICKKFVEELNGSITCFNNDKIGVTFRIKTPIDQETNKIINNEKNKIIIIEDSFIFRKLLINNLAKDFELTVFNNPEEFINNDNFDVISKADVIISDFYFDNSTQTGENIINWLIINNFTDKIIFIASSSILKLNIKVDIKIFFVKKKQLNTDFIKLYIQGKKHD